MSPDKADPETPAGTADPETPAGGKHGLRKRLALISASVLFITAGAFAYYHNASESEASLAASGSGLRRPQDRRLPHYTTYGGTSYDFTGKHKEVAGCCCTTEDVGGGVPRFFKNSDYKCHMSFAKRVDYNPTMPPLPVSEYNPTMPPLFSSGLDGYNPTMPPWLIDKYNPTMPPKGYNPTRPPGGGDLLFPGHKMMPDDDIGHNIDDLVALFNKGVQGCCCSHEVTHTGGVCEVKFESSRFWQMPIWR